MPVSPSDAVQTILEVEILCDGTAATDIVPVAMRIGAAVNGIPTASLEMIDGDAGGHLFSVSNGTLFVPGALVEIKAGYGGTRTSLFKGIVVRHGVKMNGDNAVLLTVECRHKALQLTVAPKSENHKDKTDSDIIKSLIGAAGLTATVDATSIQHETLVQYRCTDWDFLLTRAEANGLVVTCVEDGVKVAAPDLSTNPSLKLTCGLDIHEFEARLESQTQLAGANGYSWDLAKQDVVEKKATPSTTTGQGNLDSATLAKVLGSAKPLLGSSGFASDAEADGWAKARLVKAGLSRVRGRVRFCGSALAVPGKLVELDGVGARFNGKAYVGAVRHEIRQGEWTTEVDLGLSSEWFAAAHEISSPRASALTAAVGGLQVGKVLKIDTDPLAQYRVQVKLPLQKAATEGVWARMSHPVASNGFGCVFLPEVDDEVVVGFFDEDPSCPVILGFLYSSKQKPALEPAADNNLKSFTTRSKISIAFDDDKKILTVETPGKNQVVLSDEGKSILLKDQNGNQVKLSESGILLDSPKDITIKAAGKIVLQGTGNVELDSKADLKGKGMNVNLEAQVGMVAKGAASAEFSASGQTTVKGAMVMIN